MQTLTQLESKILDLQAQNRISIHNNIKKSMKSC